MISLILGLAVLGVVLYLIRQLPMDPVIHTLITIVVVICAVLWLARAFGVYDMPVPSFR